MKFRFGLGDAAGLQVKILELFQDATHTAVGIVGVVQGFLHSLEGMFRKFNDFDGISLGK